MEKLPNRVRELRKAKGWRLEDLADRINCGVTMASDLERGNRELTYAWMRRIARALKVQPGDLLLEADNSKSLSADARELVELYNTADEGDRDKILQMARLITGVPAPRSRRAA